MRQSEKFASLCAMSLVSVVFVVLMFGSAQWGSVVITLAAFVVIGWILFAFLYYRMCRRDELLCLLANAVEDGIPLAPAIRAYVQDRPRGPMRSFWTACLLSVLPVPGFYWLWYRQTSFDRRVEELAKLLEQGSSLHQALLRLPALASRETTLAAAVGESTGRLPQCLRTTMQRRVLTNWIDQFPQLLYPFVIFLILASFFAFMGIFIVPKFKRIFADFRVELPQVTETVVSQPARLLEHWPHVLIGAQLCICLVLVLSLSTTARWYFPGFSALYRRRVRSHVLRTLGLMIETGKPLPESLDLMLQLPLGRAAHSRIDGVKTRIARGDSFGESMLEAGLLPAPMIALTHTAERAGNLSWALIQMADCMHERAARIIQRTVQVLFPLTIIGLGALVGTVVVAIFLPLVKIITELVR